MYITKTTDNVRNIFNKLEIDDDIYKMKFLLYIFNSLNNDQINNKNEVNPNLSLDEDIKIFNFSLLGFSENYITIFLQYNVMVYNILTNSKDAYEDNGSVRGVNFNEEIICDFEKLSLNEKLDVFSEIIIKYDNETYFKDKITMVNFDSKQSGYDIANLVQKLKDGGYFE